MNQSANNPKQNSSNHESSPSNEQLTPDIDLIDWLLFFPYYFIFSILLLGNDIISRIAYLLGGEKLFAKVTAGHIWLHLQLLRLPGIHFEIEPFEPPPPGPLILVSNHQSLFDIPIVYNLFRDRYPRFISKRELARWIPTVAIALRKGDHGIIDRGDREQALAEIRRVGRFIKSRNSAVIIFPEGTRSRTGNLREFKTAGLLALLDEIPEATILPICIHNTWKLTWKKCRPMPRGTLVRVKVSAGIKNTEGRSNKQIVTEIRDIISKNLSELKNR